MIYYEESTNCYGSGNGSYHRHKCAKCLNPGHNINSLLSSAAQLIAQVLPCLWPEPAPQAQLILHIVGFPGSSSAKLMYCHAFSATFCGFCLIPSTKNNRSWSPTMDGAISTWFRLATDIPLNPPILVGSMIAWEKGLVFVCYSQSSSAFFPILWSLGGGGVGAGNTFNYHPASPLDWLPLILLLPFYFGVRHRDTLHSEGPVSCSFANL